MIELFAKYIAIIIALGSVVISIIIRLNDIKHLNDDVRILKENNNQLHQTIFNKIDELRNEVQEVRDRISFVEGKLNKE